MLDDSVTATAMSAVKTASHVRPMAMREQAEQVKARPTGATVEQTERKTALPSQRV